MPQPIDRVHKGASFAISVNGPRILSSNPVIAIYAMEAIGSWSNVESWLMNLYIDLMGGYDDNAATGYLSLETQSAKNAMTLAIAKRNLNEDNFKLLRAIISIAKSSQKSRNKLAHHVWGFSKEIREGLLLADPRALQKPGFCRDLIFVWTQKDLLSVIEENEKLCTWISEFRSIIMNHPANRDNRIYLQLCSVPEIREKLNR